MILSWFFCLLAVRVLEISAAAAGSRKPPTIGDIPASAIAVVPVPSLEIDHHFSSNLPDEPENGTIVKRYRQVGAQELDQVSNQGHLISLLALDFDQTLAQEHVWRKRKEYGLNTFLLEQTDWSDAEVQTDLIAKHIHAWMGTNERVQMIRALLVDFLKVSAQREVVVITHNVAAFVSGILDQCGLVSIEGRKIQVLQASGEDSKIEQLLEEYGADHQRMLHVDDDANEFLLRQQLAAVASERVFVYTVDGERGLTDNDIEKLRVGLKLNRL